MCCWRQKAPSAGPAMPAPKLTSICAELPLHGPRTHLGDKMSPLLLPTHCPVGKCDGGSLSKRKRSSVGGQCSEETCSQSVFKKQLPSHLM